MPSFELLLIVNMLLSYYILKPTACLSSHLQLSSHRSLSRPSPPPPSPPSNVLRFRTAYREKLTYLKKLGIIDSKPKNHNAPTHQSLDEILSIIDFLKSKGFSDANIPTLCSKCPKLFSSSLKPADIEPVFSFLAADVGASAEESCGLILYCPEILFSNVKYCLRPRLLFLKNIGLQKLNNPSNLNAHLLNTHISKLESKIEFLRAIGISVDESIRVCARLPAIFGYSIENNLGPKVEYLVGGMERSVEELVEFPQYFAFSLRRKIVPRHMHLKQRDVRISLKRMLLCGDQKFYAKWK